MTEESVFVTNKELGTLGTGDGLAGSFSAVINLNAFWEESLSPSSWKYSSDFR
jgi:hypothetical protein